MKKIIPLVLMVALLVACAPKEKETTKRLQALSEMAELGTVEYTVKKIVSADDYSWYKYGKRKVLFSCTAYVKAGINMKDFSAEAVTIDKEKNSISAVLPKAQILSFNMPPEEIKEEFSLVTGMRTNFTPEEKQGLLVLGEKDIRDDIPNMGILNDAEENAKLFFSALFAQLGYEQISIKFE